MDLYDDHATQTEFSQNIKVYFLMNFFFLIQYPEADL